MKLMFRDTLVLCLVVSIKINYVDANPWFIQVNPVNSHYVDVQVNPIMNIDCNGDDDDDNEVPVSDDGNQVVQTIVAQTIAAQTIAAQTIATQTEDIPTTISITEVPAPRECVGSAVAFGAQCLTFITAETLSRDAAAAACVASNGRLATLQHPQNVYNYANENYPGKVFRVDGSDAEEEGTWLWSTGLPLGDQLGPWRSGSPSGGTNSWGPANCMYLRTGLGYDDGTCTYPERYICEAVVSE